jgi:hypothetical protein
MYSTRPVDQPADHNIQHVSKTHIRGRDPQNQLKAVSVLCLTHPVRSVPHLVSPHLSLIIWPTVFWPDLSPSCPQLLLQVARSSSLDRIPSASCKVVRRSRARCVYSNYCPYFMCSFQMAVMHCHTLYPAPLFQPTQEHSFFELIKRPYQAVACGHPQMSSRLGRP